MKVHAQLALALVLLLALTIGAYAAFRADGQERERCVTTGGEVLVVHGASSPRLWSEWVCLRP